MNVTLCGQIASRIFYCVCLVAMSACSSLPRHHELPNPTGDAHADLTQIQQVAEAGGVFLPDLEDKFVLIHFWSSWCPACQFELDNLQAIYSFMHPRGLEIIAIAIDDSKEKVSKVLESHHVDFTMVVDRGAALRDRFKIRDVPVTFLVNSRSNYQKLAIASPRERSRIDGVVVWNTPEIASALEQLQLP